jgi:hypothetical protein
MNGLRHHLSTKNRLFVTKQTPAALRLFAKFQSAKRRWGNMLRRTWLRFKVRLQIGQCTTPRHFGRLTFGQLSLCRHIFQGKIVLSAL